MSLIKSQSLQLVPNLVAVGKRQNQAGLTVDSLEFFILKVAFVEEVKIRKQFQRERKRGCEDYECLLLGLVGQQEPITKAYSFLCATIDNDPRWIVRAQARMMMRLWVIIELQCLSCDQRLQAFHLLQKKDCCCLCFPASLTSAEHILI